MGTANVQGQIWGARARDWADVQERVAVPLFEAVLQETGVGPDTSVLDIGCGSGVNIGREYPEIIGLKCPLFNDSCVQWDLLSFL